MCKIVFEGQLLLKFSGINSKKVPQFLVRYNFPFFPLELLDRVKGIWDSKLVVSLMIDIWPEVIKIAKESEDRFEEFSSSGEFI